MPVPACASKWDRLVLLILRYNNKSENHWKVTYHAEFVVWWRKLKPSIVSRHRGIKLIIWQISFWDFCDFLYSVNKSNASWIRLMTKTKSHSTIYAKCNNIKRNLWISYSKIFLRMWNPILVLHLGRTDVNELDYHTCVIISRGSYIFYPNFQCVL